MINEGFFSGLEEVSEGIWKKKPQTFLEIKLIIRSSLSDNISILNEVYN